MKIIVLAGGNSKEREVSLASGLAVANGLANAGYEAVLIDALDGRELSLSANNISEIAPPEDKILDQDSSYAISQQIIAILMESYQKEKYDCLFIALHGGAGEDGRLQAMLDLMGIKYTGSGVLASALAMDKYRTKVISESIGIPTALTLFYGSAEKAAEYFDTLQNNELDFPIVVKPNSEGSTIGLTIVDNKNDLIKAIATAGKYDDNILVEEYISGRELTVSILGGQALPVVEIKPHSGFYDFKAKYTKGETDYICPAEIDEKTNNEIIEYALNVYYLLGCKGYARVDFRLNEDNELFLLELNTVPGMTATSLVPKAAQAAGYNFEQLLTKIVGLAIRKDEEVLNY